MKPDEMIEVIQACKAGKEIERRTRGCKEWILAPNPLWDFATGDYRIKPEQKKPEEVWVVTSSISGARRIVPGNQEPELKSEKAKLFREVLE